MSPPVGCSQCGGRLVGADAWLTGPMFPTLLNPGSELKIRLRDGRIAPVMKQSFPAAGWYCLDCGSLTLQASLPELRRAPDVLSDDPEWA